MKKPILPAGNLIERVSLQSPTETKGTTGQLLNSYSTVATVWAQVDMVSADETQDKVSAMYTKYVVTIRNYPDLDHTWQVLWEGAVLSITGFIHDEYRTVINCVETTRGS